ncbi:hypothetical protein FHS15_004802 [Paenibacillus castaneae]|uniref:hypothetical protein n=1 Tax=Paenibacillus castaneae TaxID=474957 RepID=UPI000C9A3C34|nr:hypothetical protein [Paenibacillus castaneae]NIK79641.1 hypothetical protein [Paenibacillus castaneae]
MLKQFICLFIFLSLLNGCQASSNSIAMDVIPASAPPIVKDVPDTQEPKENITPILIYSLPDEIFEKPRTSIPYYRNGEILFFPDLVFEQHEEGHQPWLANGMDVVTAAVSNLTGEEWPFKDQKLSYKKSDERSTASGIIIKEINNELITLFSPTIGTYEIQLKSPADTSVLFISKITLQPE